MPSDVSTNDARRPLTSLIAEAALYIKGVGEYYYWLLHELESTIWQEILKYN
jgi:hypothetical protein